MLYYEPLLFNLTPGDGRNIKFGIDYRHQFKELDRFLPDRSKAHSVMHDSEIGNAMLRFIQPGDVVIDAGANLGFFSMLMAKLVGPTGKVLAIEPDKKCHTDIELSLQQNGIENVALCDAFLWDKPGENILFHVYPNQSGYSSIVRYDAIEAKTEGRITTTLDQLTQVQRIVRCLKIDCEGSELNILKGAEELLLRGVDVVIVELNASLMRVCGYTAQDVRNYMRNFGYDMFMPTANGWLPILIPPKTELTVKGTDDRPYINVLFSTVDAVSKAWPVVVI